MRYVILLFGVCLSIAVSGTKAIAQNNSEKSITVGVYQNNPKVFLDANDRPSGFWIDIVNYISKTENWSVTYVACEWSQCLEQVEQGKIDVMVDVAYSEKRDLLFDFNNELVLASWSQIYARRGVTLDSILELDNKKVGILNSSIQKEVLSEQMKSFGIQPELVDVDSYPEMFVLLEEGEIDTAIVNNFFGKKFSPDYHIIRTNVLFNPARLHFIVKNGDPKNLLSGIDHQLKILINDRDSVYYQAIAQWLEPEQKFGWVDIQRILVNFIFYLPFFALIVVIVWNYTLKREIHYRKKIEANLQESQQRYASLTNAAPVGIFRINLQQECVYLNQYYCQLLGLDPTTDLHQGWLKRVYSEDVEKVRQHWQKFLQDQQLFSLEYRLQRTDGSLVWVHGRGTPECDAQGIVTGYVATITDISDRISMEQQLKHDALHDKLTNLANRNLLIERIDLALKRNKRYLDYQFAVLFLDLDNFKIVNDSLGHLIGDELLVKVAELLKYVIRETDVASRLGGDEFVILLEEIQGIEEAVRIAERILNSLASPLMISNREVFISASIGIIAGHNRYHSAQDLLRDADISMYRAKHNGKGKYAIFDPQMHAQAMKRLHLESDLRLAIEQKQFVLYYQPIVNLKTRLIGGFEALIRWQHPEQGLLSPFDFIQIAEETGLIIPIGEWILDTACRQLSVWQQQFNQPIRLNINLSVKQLEASLLPLLDRALFNYPLQHNTLGLEITESMLIRNVDTISRLLTQVRKKGVAVSIDDFGTGYSCFSYLHQLPIDALKIDRSFVNVLALDERNRVIAESIIALSRSIGMKTVAEGIETEEQYQWLQSQGCQFGQGYLFSRPVPLDEATKMLQDVNPKISE